MKLTRQEFLALPQKRVTLIGMSGVGKSYISGQLEGDGWEVYSVDYLIGSYYLREALGGGAEGVSQDNILGLSEFVGQVGDEARGGMALVEFQRRQKMYYDAELQSLKDACAAMDRAEGDFVLDSSGSICEMDEPGLMDELGARSLFVYLKVRQEGHEEILRRAVEYPKPLYYSPDFLKERLDSYCSQFDVGGAEDIRPVEFLRWVFPFLFEARLAKYSALAEAHGVSIYSDQFADFKGQEQFLEIVADALD